MIKCCFHAHVIVERNELQDETCTLQKQTSELQSMIKDRNVQTKLDLNAPAIESQEPQFPTCFPQEMMRLPTGDPVLYPVFVIPSCQNVQVHAQHLLKTFCQIIKQRKLALKEENAPSFEDLLSDLLLSSNENGRFLFEMEIANNILLLLFAGHDTTAVSITLLMKSLGEHPDVYINVLKGLFCSINTCIHLYYIIMHEAMAF
ncbi:putative cytochrome P450 [Helianthus debilis subsp. tardiflorus]